MESGVIDPIDFDDTLSRVQEWKKPNRTTKELFGKNKQDSIDNKNTRQNVGNHSKLSTNGPVSKASKDSDIADSKPSQTLEFLLPDSSLADNETQISNNQSPMSFTMQYEEYDNSLDYLDTPFTSFLQDESSTLLSPSYNFSGLQVGVMYPEYFM